MASNTRHWYVYGFMWAADVQDTAPPAVNAGVQTDCIRHCDLVAITSSVRGSDFDPKEPNNRLKDEEWLKEAVLVHEGVAEAYMRLGPIVPCRFGVIFASCDAVIKYMAENYERLRELLQNVGGCEEWGVKVHASRPVIKERVLEKTQELSALQKRLAKTPTGTRYLLERQLATKLETAVDEEIDAAVSTVISLLSQKAVAFRTSPVNSPGTEEEEKVLVANVSFLVASDLSQSFRDTFANLADSYGKGGIELMLTGPWPPYHFTSD